MAECLVVGASGAVGRFLLPRLLAAGYRAVAISRQPHADVPGRLQWRLGSLDRGQGAALAALPRLDAIFSLGPLDLFADWLARTPLAGTPRVVALGSMSVVSKRDSRDRQERALAQRLADAEANLRAACDARGCAWTLLRATLIYGAGIDRSLTPIAAMARRWRVFPHVPGARGLRQPVHAADLAEACLAAAQRPATESRTYDLGGAERLPFDAMLGRVRASLPQRTVSLPVPIALLRGVLAAARALGRAAPGAAALDRLDDDLVADNAPAAADFGWAPRAFAPDAATWRPHVARIGGTAVCA